MSRVSIDAAQAVRAFKELRVLSAESLDTVVRWDFEGGLQLYFYTEGPRWEASIAPVDGPDRPGVAMLI